MNDLKVTHYEDSYSQELKTPLTVPECLDRILKNSPRWILSLLQARNVIVRLFGLKTEAGHFDISQMKKGDLMGFIQVEELNYQSAIFRGDDKHLSFLIVFETCATTFICSTQVQFHNLFRRIYFYSILPLHKLIIPRLLRALS